MALELFAIPLPSCRTRSVGVCGNRHKPHCLVEVGGRPCAAEPGSAMCRYWVYATNWVRVFGWRAGIGAARWEAGLGMSRTGRAGDGPDAIPDEPRRETAVGVDRGTILTQARARRECALAYRAGRCGVRGSGARRGCPPPGDNQTAQFTGARRKDIAANGTGPADAGPAGPCLDPEDRPGPR
jgi:hypothetical protein